MLGARSEIRPPRGGHADAPIPWGSDRSSNAAGVHSRHRPRHHGARCCRRAAHRCIDRFPEGRFGIPPEHPAVSKLALEGFSPLYLVKQPLTISRPDECRYVYTREVFRMVETRAVGTLLAGCLGDFDGDGRADIALLMKRQRDGVVIPFVFQSQGAQYQATEIEGIIDPEGFAEDKSVWPGPFCLPKPASGVFKSWVGGDTVRVVGDLFTIGWKTYFWNPTAGRFDGIFTTD